MSEKRKRNESVYPSEVLECVRASGGTDRQRMNRNIGIKRPQFMRAKSLVDQMLSTSGYGPEGQF